MNLDLTIDGQTIDGQTIMSYANITTFHELQIISKLYLEKRNVMIAQNCTIDCISLLDDKLNDIVKMMKNINIDEYTANLQRSGGTLRQKKEINDLRDLNENLKKKVK